MKNSLLKTIKKGLNSVLSLAFISIAVTACFDGYAGGSSDDEGIIAISNKSVAGVSQKGPFMKGSTVTVQELTAKIENGSLSLEDSVNAYETGMKILGELSSLLRE